MGRVTAIETLETPALLLDRARLAANCGRMRAHLARRDAPNGGIDGRQAEWLRSLSQGMTVDELADRAGYSERAMYRQLRRLYERLGAANRTEALLQAMWLE